MDPEVRLPKEEDGERLKLRLLLRLPGGIPPIVIHLVFLALVFALIFGLFLSHWTMQVVRRRRKIQGRQAKKDHYAIIKQTQRRAKHFTEPVKAITYGTTNASYSMASPADSYAWMTSSELTPITSRTSHNGSLNTLGRSAFSWKRARFLLRLHATYSLRQTKRHLRKVLFRFEAWSLYQPAKIPVFNVPLPSNGTSLIIGAMYGLILLFLFIGIPFTPNYHLVVFDRAGDLFVMLLPWLYIFAAKNQPLQYLTGHSYEDLNIFHRRLGELMILLSMLHSNGKLAICLKAMAPEGFSFTSFMTIQSVMSGIAPFVIYFTIPLTSIKMLREKYYHLFISVHSWLQFFGLGVLAVHAPISRPYIIAAFLVFFTDRIIYRTLMRTRNVIARVKVLPDGQTANLKIDKDSNGGQTYWEFLQKFINRAFADEWITCHHVFIRVPDLEGHENELHPYFICCAAPSEHPWASIIDLNLIIPARGPFSQKLLRKAAVPFMTLDIDGPYGSCHALDMLMDREVCILIGGGPGIAGVWPLAWALIDDELPNDVEMGGQIQSRQEVVLVWTYRSLHEIEWIGGEDEIKLLEAHGISVLLVGPTETRDRTDLEVDIEWWMYRNDPHDRNPRTGIVCCGSPDMQRVVRNKAAEEIAKGKRISYHEMSFGL